MSADRPLPEARCAAFFDLDRTVIDRPAMAAFARPLYDAGFINSWLVARGAWTSARFKLTPPNDARMEKWRRTGLRIVSGWDATALRHTVAAAVPHVIAPAVYDGARALLRSHQAQGHAAILISAEPEEIVEPERRARAGSPAEPTGSTGNETSTSR